LFFPLHLKVKSSQKKIKQIKKVISYVNLNLNKKIIHSENHRGKYIRQKRKSESAKQRKKRCSISLTEAGKIPPMLHRLLRR
jgi:hypothetical protein